MNKERALSAGALRYPRLPPWTTRQTALVSRKGTHLFSAHTAAVGIFLGSGIALSIPRLSLPLPSLLLPLFSCFPHQFREGKVFRRTPLQSPPLSCIPGAAPFREAPWHPGPQRRAPRASVEPGHRPRPPSTGPGSGHWPAHLPAQNVDAGHRFHLKRCRFRNVGRSPIVETGSSVSAWAGTVSQQRCTSKSKQRRN